MKQVVGLDLGDRYSYLVVLDMATGELLEEARVATTPGGLTLRFRGVARQRIALEVGTHSPWVSRLLSDLGHEVLVANPRKVRLIAQSRRKTDQRDAEILARLARVDPKLLSPVIHRNAATQSALAVIKARDLAVTTRTRVVNHLRGAAKACGVRLPSCSSPALAHKASEAIPSTHRPAFDPLLELLEHLNQTIREYDRQIQRLTKGAFTETQKLLAIAGVGELTALAFVLILGNPQRFARSRDVGAYLGLAPAQRASGDLNPQLRISKEGDPLLRRLLVTAAHYILGRFGPDTDLRRFGQRLIERGGKSAKKRAIVAVARKLAVLLHHLWKTGVEYEPLYRSQRMAAKLPPAEHQVQMG